MTPWLDAVVPFVFLAGCFGVFLVLEIITSGFPDDTTDF